MLPSRCQRGAFHEPCPPGVFLFGCGALTNKVLARVAIYVHHCAAALLVRTRMVQCFGIQVHHHHHHFHIPHACWSSCHECGNAVFDQSVALFLCHRSEDLHCF